MLHLYLSVLIVAQADRFQLKKLLPAVSASTVFSICKGVLLNNLTLDYMEKLAKPRAPDSWV